MSVLRLWCFPIILVPLKLFFMDAINFFIDNIKTESQSKFFPFKKVSLFLNSSKSLILDSICDFFRNIIYIFIVVTILSKHV